MRRRVFLVPTLLALGFAFLYVPILTLIIFSFNNSKLVTEIGRASCRERVFRAV